MIQLQITQLVQDAVSLAYPQLDTRITDVTVEIPTHTTHGDYACAVAMQLAKHLGEAPIAIAEAIAARIDTAGLIEEVQVVAPGFINIRVTAEYLTGILPHYTSDPFPNRHETVVVEYSSPNIAKEMHIGHLLTTTYGEAVKRMYQFLGYHVVADNHLGDWGTQFGKLIYAMKHMGDRAAVEAQPLEELQALYVRFHDAAEKQPELLDAARLESKKLEDGDEENTALWQWICSISMGEFEKLYALLDVSFDTVLGESHFVPMQKEHVDTMVKNKIATVNEDGSIAVLFEEHGMELPSMPIMRSDGGSLYVTRDIATIKYRLDNYHPLKMIYVVGNEQSLHFQQLFSIARLMEWGECDYVHMSYGLLRLPEGKMSSRKGTTIFAKDVIEEGRKRVRALLEAREMEASMIEELVDPIAIGAIKYGNFIRNRHTQMVFDWDTALSFEGNSGPYLQYAYARSRSVLAKASELMDLQPILSEESEQVYVFATEQERQLMLHITRFGQAVQQAGEHLQVNVLAQYLYDLAALFNKFYAHVTIIDPKEEAATRVRLRLVELAGDTLKEGLGLLSISTPERM